MISELESILQSICLISADDVFRLCSEYDFGLYHYGTEKSWKQETIQRRYAYRPGAHPGAPLIVCHADTVREAEGYQYNPETGIVTCLALDDRLGIALMIYGIQSGELSHCAFLVCDNEEIGKTTATLFAEDCRVDVVTDTPNMLVEFDRRGTDAVTYDYADDTWHSLLESVGFQIGEGTFSDISSLEGLRVKGVNVGIGYHGEHRDTCFANLYDTANQYLKTLVFIRSFGHIRFNHEPRFDSWGYKSKKYGVKTIPLLDNPIDDWDDESEFEPECQCDSCGDWFVEPLHPVGECDICDDCLRLLGKAD